MQEIDEMRGTVREAMEYAVPEGYMDQAEDVVEQYRDDQIALLILQEFYTGLPDAQEDWIRDIVVVARQRGIFLLGVLTGGKEGYLYLVSREGIEFQGKLADGDLDPELLDFFEYESGEAFQEVCSAADQLPVYESLQLDEDICPACHAYVGEEHELGCPVEVCPWCGGHLVHCSCRFDQLGVDAITTEKELLELEALLEERGRIPFSREQRPSFADEGPGVMLD
ncbi:MAG: hypothetical protein CSA31_02325 [Desulfobulbus propionicus]|nr:MAG: hypothetical protein CSA31_02325 [Desulfobulbus propionicus]